MSLIVKVSENRVSIPKYGIQFSPKLPHQSLSKAALETYAILRHSVSLQINSKESEKKEVILLLSNYGYSLYQGIFPPSLEKKIIKESDIRIFPMDDWCCRIPWQLLNNGTSFLALTKGIHIGPESTSQKLTERSARSQSSLRISLNSFPQKSIKSDPSNGLFQELPNPFIEKLISSDLQKYSNLILSGECSANHHSIIESLEANPDILLLSSCTGGKRWYDQNPLDKTGNENWFENQFLPHLSRAADSGLKLLILKTSEFETGDDSNNRFQIKSYFRAGVPYIIIFSGRLEPGRLQIYLQKLFKVLLSEKSLIVAHRQALNALSTELTHCWDWSWIRLYVNDSIGHPNQNPVGSFAFYQPTTTQNHPTKEQEKKFHLYHSFPGSIELLESTLKQISDLQINKILLLESKKGQLLDQYLFESIRRDKEMRDSQIDVMFYPSEDLKQTYEDASVDSNLISKFSFLYEYGFIDDFFEHSIVHYQDVPKGNSKLLLIYYPPAKANPFLDHWIQNKQRTGWKIVIMSTNEFETAHGVKKISLDFIEKRQLYDFIEDRIPELMLFNKPLIQWENIKSFYLFRSLSTLSPSSLSREFSVSMDTRELWQSVLKKIMEKLSSVQHELFWTIFLFRTPLSLDHLNTLVVSNSSTDDIMFLLDNFLVESDLNRQKFWISSSPYTAIKLYKAYDSDYLNQLSQKLLVHSIKDVHQGNSHVQEKIQGFYNCSEFVSKNYSVSRSVTRMVQFGKKISTFLDDNSVYSAHCVRFILNRINKGDLKTSKSLLILSCANLIEKLPTTERNIEIYKSLLEVEDQNRNWQNVSEIQMKLAVLFMKVEQTDKAIGLLTSTLQLNSDLENPTKRYHNLIQIALLLLDLDEFEKVKKLVEGTDFVDEVLNNENLALLWLIDGHLHYDAGRYDLAFHALTKYMQFDLSLIPIHLYAKTNYCLSKLYELKGNVKKGIGFLIEAIKLYIQSNDQHSSNKLLNELIEKTTQSEDVAENIIQLENLLDSTESAANYQSVNSITDLLGGLHFRAGNSEKSTYYYKLSYQKTEC
ncbi:MAG: hypothetical protein GY786_08790 [Proteobacteria bacterium]|nr:hypothetical protein [Pseudomonadota bacterium]